MNQKWQGRQVVVVFDEKSATARLYERNVNDNRLLSLQFVEGQLKDKETGSTWELTSGKAVAGPLAGAHLKPLPAIVSFRNTWFAFHPQSQRWPNR